MAITLTWDYGTLREPKGARIESSSDFTGPFSEVATVDFPERFFEDVGGTNNTYYRMIIIYTDLSESEPTIPKRIMAPPTCRVFGYVLSVTGKPVAEETLRFSLYPHTLPQANDVVGYITNTIIKEVKTGADGFFEVDLLQGAVVNVECIRLGLNYKSRVVPAVDVKEFSQWLMEA